MSRQTHSMALIKALAILLAFSLLFSYFAFNRSGPAAPLAARPTPPAPPAGTPPGASAGGQQPPTAAVPPSPGSTGSPQSGSGPEVVWATGPSLSQPLRTIPAVVDKLLESETGRENELAMPKVERAAAVSGFDSSIVQSSPVGNTIPAPLANFEGVNNVNGVLPPDTEGDIGYDPGSGKSYYVQWVNLSFKIWDVTAPGSPVAVYGPANGNTLWASFGGDCQFTNNGDPIVLFDHLANRWLMSQFALNSPFYQCIAVSQTADPTGAWYRYAFLWSTTKLNDYPKFGVWPDGYYMTVNQFIGCCTWGGAGVAVFDRTAMLAGSPASMQKFDLLAAQPGFGGMLPSDLDGPAPAAGTPNYFSEWDNTTWLGDANDTLRIWNFHVDWTTPSNTTFGADASFNPNQLIATSNVDPNLCGPTMPACIQQPGTIQRLQTLADRLMHRMQYRNFGSYQTLVSNHSVDFDGLDDAGIHWFELRKSGGSWSINQQGVYAPDANSRWMGSIAMDKNGDMGLGYSVSSSTTYPSVRYTGRLATDTLGLLPQGEASFIAGGGSQTHTANRWGDYSMMAVDPKDDCTFWYTQEYYASTSPLPNGANWQTRIGAFRFPSCKAVVARVYPPDGSTSCLRPVIGADFALTDLMRSGGSFNPSVFALNLDGSDVTGLAAKLQTETSPASVGSILYTPLTDLSLGPHQAIIAYPVPGGTDTFTWNFTAASIACPAPGTH